MPSKSNKLRKFPRIIRYRNYDQNKEFSEYKREMVTLHIPFQNEQNDILADLKLNEIYRDNERLIMKRRKEFESDLDIQKTLEICQQLFRDDELLIAGNVEVANPNDEPDPYAAMLNDPGSRLNVDIQNMNRLGAVYKKRENILPTEEFNELMRKANKKQRELCMHLIHNLLSGNPKQILVFLTGAAGCGKTFVLRLIMEIYNRFTDNDGLVNAFIACASTGKAAVAIDGVTVHNAFHLIIKELHKLHPSCFIFTEFYSETLE